MNLIKIGNRIINLNAIAHINLDAMKIDMIGGEPAIKGVSIIMLSSSNSQYGFNSPVSEQLFFEGREAELLKNYFQRWDISTDVSLLQQRQPNAVAQDE